MPVKRPPGAARPPGAYEERDLLSVIAVAEARLARPGGSGDHRERCLIEAAAARAQLEALRLRRTEPAARPAAAPGRNGNWGDWGAGRCRAGTAQAPGAEWTRARPAAPEPGLAAAGPAGPPEVADATDVASVAVAADEAGEGVRVPV